MNVRTEFHVVIDDHVLEVYPPNIGTDPKAAAIKSAKYHKDMGMNPTVKKVRIVTTDEVVWPADEDEDNTPVL